VEVILETFKMNIKSHTIYFPLVPIE